ncbi:Gfo/Idh/MocA family oxidoreductase [Dactylosporangium sp. NPDC005572]|uniref:Gfo/Idh/MocA family protein n=1 Tax=Dactylosporangium sp. NPDC005572 TaxID=3156889 RepID=UPI0033BB199C
MTASHLRWALVGTSGYAARACLPAFAAVEDADLVAVLSSSAERAAAFAAGNGIAKPYADLTDLCADDEVDAMWIASPSHLHFEQAMEAIRSGRHVLLEKPLALESGQAWKLVEAADAAGVHLAVGYQARYVPAHLEMQRIIASGELGPITTVRSLYGMRRTGPPASWRGDKEKARWGVLADIGTHHIDLLRMLAGEITGAAGFTAHQRGYATEDLAVAALQFETGVLGTLTATGNNFTPATVVEVVGFNGMVRATDTSPDGQGTAVLIRTDGTETDITGPTPRSFDAQLATVNRAFRGADVAYATGRDGARNLEILEMIAQ